MNSNRPHIPQPGAHVSNRQLFDQVAQLRIELARLKDEMFRRRADPGTRLEDEEPERAGGTD